MRKLAQELGRRDHRVSHRLVAELLHELGYSLQANAKTLEGSSDPDSFEELRCVILLPCPIVFREIKISQIRKSCFTRK